MIQGSDIFLRQRLAMAQLAAARQQSANSEPPAYTTHTTSSTAQPDDDESDVNEDAFTPVNINLDVSLEFEGEVNDIDTSSPVNALPEEQVQRFLKQTIATLKDNRLLESLDEEGNTRDRPLNINVQAGIRIKGQQNFIRPGTPKGGEQDLPLRASDSSRRRGNGQVSSEQSKPQSRKRRSLSVRD